MDCTIRSTISHDSPHFCMLNLSTTLHYSSQNLLHLHLMKTRDQINRNYCTIIYCTALYCTIPKWKSRKCDRDSFYDNWTELNRLKLNFVFLNIFTFYSAECTFHQTYYVQVNAAVPELENSSIRVRTTGPLAYTQQLRHRKIQSICILFLLAYGVRYCTVHPYSTPLHSRSERSFNHSEKRSLPVYRATVLILYGQSFPFAHSPVARIGPVTVQYCNARLVALSSGRIPS